MTNLRLVKVNFKTWLKHFLFYSLFTLVMMPMQIVGSAGFVLPPKFLLSLFIALAAVFSFLRAHLQITSRLTQYICGFVYFVTFFGVGFFFWSLALHKAQDYGSFLASVLEENSRSGQWPKDTCELTDAQIRRIKEYNFGFFFPCASVTLKKDPCGGPVTCASIGPFFITISDKSKKRIKVSRRDISFVWDWDSKQWKDGR